jgi:hypothetical protein
VLESYNGRDGTPCPFPFYLIADTMNLVADHPALIASVRAALGDTTRAAICLALHSAVGTSCPRKPPTRFKSQSGCRFNRIREGMWRQLPLFSSPVGGSVGGALDRRKIWMHIECVSAAFNQFRQTSFRAKVEGE